RRLERNLHDGAQQNLVALKLKIAAARNLAVSDPQRAQVMLDELNQETSTAIETLRELARGLYPPILAQDGLVAALEAQARRTSMPVEVVSQGVSRPGPGIETRVRFCLLYDRYNL